MPYDANDLKKLKVSELKDILTKHNLSITGKKEDLINRILSLDQNQDVAEGENDDEDPDAHLAPPGWDGDSFSNDKESQIVIKELLGTTSGLEPAKPTSTSKATESTTATSTRRVSIGKRPPGLSVPEATFAATPANTPLTATLDKSMLSLRGMPSISPVEPSPTLKSKLGESDKPPASAELEKRKKRAERFGIPLGDKEKLLQRAHRFQEASESSEKALGKLDSALGSASNNKIQNSLFKNAVSKLGGEKKEGSKNADEELLKKRSERFGKPISADSIVKALIPEEVLKKREERFGVVDQSELKNVPSGKRHGQFSRGKGKGPFKKARRF